MKPTVPLAAACLALAAAAAFAQTQAPQNARVDNGRGDNARAEPWRQHREQHEQEMMTDLHTILRIRTEQETAFQAFAAAMQSRGHEGRERMGEMQGMDALTTPQLIDQMDARKAAHDAEERQRGAAVKRFYAALSPEQQQVFDALRRLTMGHGGWGGGHMHGPRGAMGGHGTGGPPPPM